VGEAEPSKAHAVGDGGEEETRPQEAEMEDVQVPAPQEAAQDQAAETASLCAEPPIMPEDPASGVPATSPGLAARAGQDQPMQGEWAVVFAQLPFVQEMQSYCLQ
jgi:hypothetical protein